MADLELQDELRAVARKLLAESRSSPDWGLLADVGWLGLEVPEQYGGAGAGFAEVAVVLRELGRALARSPFLGRTVLAVAALELLAPSPVRDELLAFTATAESQLSVVLATGESTAPPFQIVATDNGLQVNGSAAFVPDVREADRLLLLANDPDGEPVLVSVTGDAAGLQLTQQTVLDETRSLTAVSAEALPVAAGDIWRFRTSPSSSAMLLRCRGALAVACDSFGIAEQMLDATVTYAKGRQQFGRPIGSFQGVKFMCADMLVASRISQELLATAIEALASANPAVDCVRVELEVARAKAYVTAHAVDSVGKALQLHGGIGYTWDGGIHVALKRAALNRSWFGSPSMHRRRLAHELCRPVVEEPPGIGPVQNVGVSADQLDGPA